MQDSKFDEWAILELMGHRRMAGKITEAAIGGATFIRVDIPTDGKFTTQYYSPQAIYCITPTTEEMATKLAKSWQPEPVYRWELEITEHASPSGED
jgi:hypothetical protein